MRRRGLCACVYDVYLFIYMTREHLGELWRWKVLGYCACMMI